MIKILLAASLALLLSCAEEPSGIIVMNEETIENFFEKDKQSWNPPEHLNLLIDQPDAEAKIPPKPKGYVRLNGTLRSDGTYVLQGSAIKNRGSSFKNSIFGMLGQSGQGGNAWFYADYNPDTGYIEDARAYLYGFMGGVCDMRQKTGGSYGRIEQNGFYLNISGPCLFPELTGSTMEYALLIQGGADLYSVPNGANIQINYIIDNTGEILSVPPKPRSDPAVFDSGKGRAWLN